MRTVSRQLVLFGLVGLAGTAAYLLVFLLVRGLGPQPAALIARVLVAFPTSWLNARLTFRSRVAAHRAYAAGLSVLALGALLTAAAMSVLHSLDPDPSGPTDLAVLLSTQLVAAAMRFTTLRSVALTGTSKPVHVAQKAGSPTVIWTEETNTVSS